MKLSKNKIIQFLVVNFIFVLTFLIPNKIFSQDLSLPNGKYKIEYDEQFRNHPGYNFTIKDNEITFHEIQGDITRRIEKNSDCSLRIEKEKIDESTLTEFQKIINKQHPYYSFTKINNGEFKFIYRIDLHVMINSGKFIKIGQKKNCVQPGISISGFGVYIIKNFANCSFVIFPKTSYNNPRQQKYPTVTCKLIKPCLK